MVERLKGRKGFTLAETLAAVLILLLASAVVAGGIPAASNAYYKAVDAANAQVLLSTTAAALRSELSTAWNVEIPDSTHVSYWSASTGCRSEIFINDDVIMIQEYADWTKDILDSNSLKKPDARPLVSTAIRRTVRGNGNDPDSMMTAAFSGIKWSDSGDAVVFCGVEVKKDGNVIASMPDIGDDESALPIRVLLKEVSLTT